jgi:hypothetical protein
LEKDLMDKIGRSLIYMSNLKIYEDEIIPDNGTDKKRVMPKCI